MAHHSPYVIPRQQLLTALQGCQCQANECSVALLTEARIRLTLAALGAVEVTAATRERFA